MLTGVALGDAADFGTAELAGLNSFMAPPTPVGVPGKHAGSSQYSEKAGGASKPKPCYKRPWVLISQVIACLVGIGLLFVLLFPVVKAIAQHIVDVSKLNVDRVVISQPTNTSYVPFPRSSYQHHSEWRATLSSFSLRMDGWVNNSRLISDLK